MFSGFFKRGRSRPPRSQTARRPNYRPELQELEQRLAPASINFAAIGNYGLASQPEAQVANLVKSWNPNFVITLGDNNYQNGAASTIDANIGQYYHSFIGNYTGSYGAGAASNSFFPALGDHDFDSVDGTGYTPYLNYFTLPGNGRYYDYNQGVAANGNALVEFFSINSDSNEPDGITSTSKQGAWLQSQLAASTATWKLVYFERPPYSSDAQQSPVMQWPFQAWGASAVLSASAHNYERLVENNNFPYFINGLGGVSTEKFTDPIAGSEVRYHADFGAMLVNANDAQLTFQFISQAGQLVDTYTLYANPNAVAPVAPGNLTASAVSSGQINLAWADNSSNETGFQIQQSTDGTNFTTIATPGANANSYNVSGLTANVQYYYRVLAANGAGTSAYSNVANAVTTDSSVPPPPSLLTATVASSTTVNLAWTETATVTGFRIYRSTDGVRFSKIAGTGAYTAGYSDSTLSANTQYYYQVLAYNSSGNSNFSSVVTTQTAAPAAPTNLALNVASTNTLNLSWTDNSTNESQFQIQRSTDGVNFTLDGIVGPGASTFNDTSLAANTQYSYRVLAFNGAGNSASSVVTTGKALVISPAALATGTVNNAYTTVTFTATGGSGTGYSFSESGTLPTGLTFAGGALSGTPTQSGTFPITVTVTDSQNGSGSQNYSLVVDPAITISPTTLATATVGNAYSQQLTVSGGSGSYSKVAVSGLPANLSASLAGSTITISGTPASSTGSPFTVNVTVTDSQSGSGSQGYSLVVDPAITISPTTLATATVGNAYSQQLTVSGGSGSYSKLAVTGLSANLSSSLAGSTITISGTPSSAAGSPFTVNVTVTDSQNGSGSQGYSLVVDPAITISPTTLATATVGNAYSQKLTVSGGSGNYSKLAVTGLPANLSASLAGSTITISGTPSSANGPPFSVNVTVTDSQAGTGSQGYSLVVNSAITISPTTLATATVGNAYSQQLTVSGGSGSYSKVAVSGLPANLSASLAGSAITISGTPTTASGSPFTVNVTVTDSQSGSGSQGYSLVVDPAITISPTTLATATLGNAYSQQLTVSGGSGSYSKLAVTGLPTNLSASLSGSTITISGTPTTASGSPFSVNVTVTDSQSGSGSQGYSLVIDPAITISPTALATATPGSAYSQQLTVSGGSGSYSSLAVTGLPASLSASLAGSTITISGNPTSPAGSPFTVNVTVTDSQGGSGSQAYSLVVDPTITISPTTLAAATVGNAYSQQLTLSGGLGSYSKLVVTGLPASLSASLSGSIITISGTPTTANGAPFTVKVAVSDSQGNSGSQQYSLTVNPASAAPSNLSAVVASWSAVKLTWTASSTNLTGFEIQRSTDGVYFSRIARLDSRVTSYWSGDLKAKTQYYYQVLAYNAAGSTASSVVTTRTAAPEAPSGLTATATSATTASLAWSDNSINETGFKILRSTDGIHYTLIAFVGAKATSYSDSGLSANTKYYYRVKSYNAVDTSDSSNPATTTTPRK